MGVKGKNNSPSNTPLLRGTGILAIPKFGIKKEQALLYIILPSCFLYLIFISIKKSLVLKHEMIPKGLQVQLPGIVSLWIFATCPWSIPTRNASANEAQQLTVLGTCGAVAVSCCRFFFSCAVSTLVPLAPQLVFRFCTTTKNPSSFIVLAILGILCPFFFSPPTLAFQLTQHPPTIHPVKRHVTPTSRRPFYG